MNLDKCAFEVESGNFLGFPASQRGIEIAPKKIKAIQQMQPLITKKQIQTLTGKLAVLNIFISKYLDRLRPFFTVLKGASSKGLESKCDKAFHSIKEYVAYPLSLSQPVDGEDLYLYLATLIMAMRATLVRSDRDSKQKPVHFVSKMLTDDETRYTNFEQIALALRMVVMKPRP